MLLVGINMDTARLTRGAGKRDLAAHARCHGVADTSYVNSILRNHLRIPDLGYFRHALENVNYRDRLAWCDFPNGCERNLMGILADFLLALDEIDFVVLSASNAGRISFSARSENPNWDASAIMKTALAGMGHGGGHAEMAGGVAPDADRFDAEEFRTRLFSLLGM